MSIRRLMLATALVSVGAAMATAQEVPTPPGGTYTTSTPPAQRQAYFGEMHLHTTLSFDAWTFGTKITPDQAYKFARGETVMVPIEQVSAEEHIKGTKDVPARRAWPLDFMAVTDHSEAMGVITQLDDPNNPLRNTPVGQAILKKPSTAFYMVAQSKVTGKLPPGLNAAQATRHAWDVVVKAANDNYQPGKFTTFIAYEWTSMAEGKYNLHRNVFFNSDHAPLPFTSADSSKPEDLWTYLGEVRGQGIEFSPFRITATSPAG